jgi:hypothetical protein
MTLETFAKGIYLKNDTADAAASVDFDLLKQAGIRFVVPRMGDGDALYGASGFGHLNPGAFVDAGFAANVQAAYDYGMVCIPCWTLRIGPDYPQATGSPFQDDNQLVPFLYAQKAKKPGVSYQAMMVEIARDANGEIPDTDSNMAEYLDRFVSWIYEWLSMQYYLTDFPIYVALDKETWEYGSQSVTNLIAHPGQEWPYMLLGQSEVEYGGVDWEALPEPSETLPVWEPGNLSGYKSKKGVIWAYAEVFGIFGTKTVSSWLLLFWNTPAGMVEKLGYTPRNWSGEDPNSGDSVPDGEPGETVTVDLSALVEAMDTLTAQVETQFSLLETILAKLKLPWWLRGKN